MTLPLSHGEDVEVEIPFVVVKKDQVDFSLSLVGIFLTNKTICFHIM